ncbi:hypothetical protein [Ramlibacter sp. WS9]|uniref:hypothetical protein n=1 Tax=Ramlibacter sp. WS9 TaxID=1882741 RepID=UPI0011426C61|nr:hypothetical protein [Ramlibacter sp. WS9]ROZ66184.1 hypothetical protein EEB15_26785 [Ramlibacter sp. WS9]
MFKHLFTATVLCAGVAAFAQSQPQAIGKVAEVEGVVTVSNGVTVATAVLGSPVIEGTRYVTAASGSTLLRMDRGCDIRLKPNESLLIDGNRDCAALLALVQPVGANLAAVVIPGAALPAAGTTVAGTAGSTGVAAGVLGAGGALAAGLIAGNSGGSAAAPGGGGGIPVPPISGQ